MEEAANVVVLVEGGEEAFGFSGGELESGKCDRLAKLAGFRKVEGNEIGQRPHRRAASGFSGHGESGKTRCSLTLEKQ